MKQDKLFIADIHWGSNNNTQSEDEFIKLLEFAWQKNYELYILGDLFEYWIGKNQIKHFYFNRIVEIIREFSLKGLKINILTGNRDLILDKYFAAYTHTNIQHNKLSISLGNHKTILLHGDELYAVPSYLLYRAITHNVLSQKLFQWLPDYSKYQISNILKKVSSVSKYSYKNRLLLNKFYLFSLFKNYDIVICAHIHYKQFIRFRFKNDTKFLITLPCWEENKEPLIYKDNKLYFVDISKSI